MFAPNITPEDKNEIARLTLRHFLGLFPVAGPILNDILFEFRNNVRQERLNHFVSLLEDAFIQHNIPVEKLRTEQILDLLEQALTKVAATKSVNKRAAFKNILMRGIAEPAHVNDCEIFNQLLSDLKDVQIRILEEHKTYLSEGKPLLQKLHELNNSYWGNPSWQNSLYSDLEAHVNQELLKHKIAEVKEGLEHYKLRCRASLFELDTDQYHYFLRDLMGKGLLIDQGVGTYDPTPLQYMGITQFGLRFLAFIMAF